MTDRKASDAPVENLGDLPIQPTGSGVADLEIAYEQMKVAEGAEPDLSSPVGGTSGDADLTPTVRDHDSAESAAHPS